MCTSHLVSLDEHRTIYLLAGKFLLEDMSGLRKAKKYDWKDSNLALFGSDLEKNVRNREPEVVEIPGW